MKALVTVLIAASFAAIGTYFGASEHGAERAYFIFIGVAWGFYYRHWFYTK